MTHLYVPILKLKAGEVKALKELSAEHKEKIIPLFEVPPVPWDYVKDEPSKSVADHIAKVSEMIGSCCGGRVFLDFSYVADEIIIQSPDNFEKQFTDILLNNIFPTPVVYLSMEREYIEKILKIANDCKNGLCVRIENEDFEDDHFQEQLELLLTQANIAPKDIDIILDMGQVPSKGSGPISVGIKNIVRFFPRLQEWRSLTLAATSFPETLASFNAQTATTVDRPEWGIWRQLATSGSVPRPLFYGDYGVASPEPFQMDPRMMRLGAKIKYTFGEQWIIVKGIGIKRGGSAQFYALAKWLTESQFYYGEEFSWGDKFIAAKARREGGSGNQTNWVSVGMNHHFAVTVDQLSKLS